MNSQKHKSLLHQMTQETPTCLWNDSASVKELDYAIEHGAVGATCNPVIALNVAKQEMDHWRERILRYISEMPVASEDEIGWRLIKEVSARGAEILMPVFEEHKGKNGRLAIQTDPRFYRDADAIVAQAIDFSQLRPNMIVKIPVTDAGVQAVEEATFHGVSILATVCFTVPQCLFVAEAVERGLERRQAAGRDISTMAPVCALMVGRLDDWLKIVANKEGIIIDPGYLEWAGIAVFKKAYGIYRHRGYRTRLLSAAFRNHMHWSEFIGGDVIISPPHKWQLRFNASDIEVIPRIDNPVEPKIVEELLRKFTDFRRAYAEDGLKSTEFDSFGSTARTLRQFIAACADLSSMIRDFMMP
jgi:transaldolase